jgi:hypothetical protein
MGRMSQLLAPCPACSRHVKTSEAVCPFCKGALAGDLAMPAVPGTSARLSRAALFAVSASIAVATGGAASACSSGTTTGNVDAGPDAGTQQAAYGGPPIDSGTDTGTDAGTDSGGQQAAYGAPPIDSGSD